MTLRAAAALVVAAALVAAGAAASSLVVVGIAIAVLTVAAVAVDARRAPDARVLRAARDHDTVLSVGATNAVVLHVRGPQTVARVREEWPGAAHASASEWRVTLPATLRYTLRPVRRGRIESGRTVIRARGPWGLGWRQVALPTAASVDVDADITAVRVYEALARRGQLAELGVRTLRLRTEGTEFERVREAVPDDPLRSVNWKATARTGRLMATELMPERAQPVILCVDHGRLMGVGAGELTKLDHAINAALLLAHVALRSGDRAGLVTFVDSVTAMLRPRAGALQLRRILDELRPLTSAETEADYDSAFAHVSRWQTRRALIVVFTDVLDADQGAALIRQCARLQRHHAVLVVTVRDPAVDDASVRTPSSGAVAYARAIAGALIADREDTLQVLRRSGVATIDADARTLSPRLVNRYLELKRRAIV